MARRRVIEDTFYRAREEGDKNVFYIDGQGLYRGYHKEECSTDGSHPNDIGMIKRCCIDFFQFANRFISI